MSEDDPQARRAQASRAPRAALAPHEGPHEGAHEADPQAPQRRAHYAWPAMGLNAEAQLAVAASVAADGTMTK